MLDELLTEVSSMSTALDDVLANIAMPESVDISFPEKETGKQIFSNHKRKSWDKDNEARCDFTPNLRLVSRAGILFISLWQKSVFGRTLTEIKSDDDEVEHFAQELVPVMKKYLGSNLDKGDWAMVTTPMRRHKERNFASMIAESIAEMLGIPFYFDCAHCSSKHRVGAEFTINNLPKESNIIVFDDFVTTGSTLKSMHILLNDLGKNVIFVAGINNKI